MALSIAAALGSVVIVVSNVALIVKPAEAASVTLGSATLSSTLIDDERDGSSPADAPPGLRTWTPSTGESTTPVTGGPSTCPTAAVSAATDNTAATTTKMTDLFTVQSFKFFKVL